MTVEIVSANGLEIAFERTGEGPPLFLLHGAEGDHTMFAALAEQLSADFTIIACDQRDSGQTRNPDVEYGFGELADDVAALISALDYNKVHLLGQSFGGVVAQSVALRHPDRIDRLILSSTFKLGINPLPLNPDAFASLAALRQELPSSLMEIAAYFFPPSFLTQFPSAADVFAGAQRTPEQAARRARIGAKPINANLAEISAPTLVLAGSADALISPQHTRSLAEDIPGAQFQLLEGVGHIGPIQAPETVAKVVTDFLQSAE